MKTIKLLVVLLTVMTLICACSNTNKSNESYSSNGFPDVYYKDGAIYLNGNVIRESDGLKIKRIDSNVICIYTGEEYINIAPDGSTLTLGDLITDKEAYENRIKSIVDLELATRNSLPPTDEQYDEMMDVLSSYEEAMKLDFCLDNYAITIFSPGFGIRIHYSEPMIDEKYKPNDDLMCTSHMTGKCISYFPEEIDKNEYKSLWVSDSMEIHNYEGTDYQVYKTRYQKETSYGSKSDDDIYYLVISKVNENDERVIVGYKPIEEDYCCSFSDFVKTLNEINSKN